MQGTGYMKQLDGLRFLAVSAVMFGHWTLTIPALKTFDLYSATFGVNLFFVLSGFLIAQILLKNKQQEKPAAILRTFYIRRFLRIFPLYYAVVFVGILINLPGARAYFLSLVTYTANYPFGISTNLGYLSHLWSLCVEEQFYIFSPSLLYLFQPEIKCRLLYP